MDIKVTGEWKGDVLVWVFRYGLFTHSIRDNELKKWIKNTSSLNNYVVGGTITKQHTDCYIKEALLKGEL